MPNINNIKPHKTDRLLIALWIVLFIALIALFFLVRQLMLVKCDMKEYQIRIEQDSAFVYDNGRFVGYCLHGKDGIDSIILNDNR